VKRIIGVLTIGTVFMGMALANGICLNFNGKHSNLAGFVDDKVLFVSPKDFLTTLGASIIKLEPFEVTVRLCDKIFKLPFVIREAAPYLNGVQTATTLGYQASQTNLALNITGAIPDCKPPTSPSRANVRRTRV
jgi:hypothetical protein